MTQPLNLSEVPAADEMISLLRGLGTAISINRIQSPDLSWIDDVHDSVGEDFAD